MCFRANAKNCIGCIHNTSCATEVLEKLSVIGKEINVNDLIVAARGFLDKRGIEVKVVDSTIVKARMADAAKINFDTKDTESAIKGIAIRAQKIAIAMAKRGIDMSADAKRKTNSLRAVRFKPSYMANIQEMMNESHEFTREMVREAIERDGEMKGTSINNSCSFAISAMKAMGFITEIGQGKYVIN